MKPGKAAVGWGASVAYMALIYVLSDRALSLPPEILFPHADKLVHAGEYGLLGLLLVAAFSSTWPAACGARLAVAAALLASLYGASDEWHQSFVPGRRATVGDWLADSAGAALAAAAAAAWRRATSSRSPSPAPSPPRP